MTYDVFGETLSLTQSINQYCWRDKVPFINLFSYHKLSLVLSCVVGL